MHASEPVIDELLENQGNQVRLMTNTPKDYITINGALLDANKSYIVVANASKVDGKLSVSKVFVPWSEVRIVEIELTKPTISEEEVYAKLRSNIESQEAAAKAAAEAPGGPDHISP